MGLLGIVGGRIDSLKARFVLRMPQLAPHWAGRIGGQGTVMPQAHRDESDEPAAGPSQGGHYDAHGEVSPRGTDAWPVWRGPPAQWAASKPEPHRPRQARRHSTPS